jgi:hypothetical protein
MTKHNHVQLIQDVTEALLGSVPKRRHEDVLGALKRCQELIGRLSAAVLDLDRRQMYGDLMIEAKLYANVLDGFFGEKEMSITQWMDIGNGYNPYAHLTDKGVLKATPSAAEKRLADLKLDFPQQDIDELDQLIADIDRAMAPTPLKSPLVRAPRGRPVGSKNKPKTGIVSKANAIMKAKKGHNK